MTARTMTAKYPGTCRTCGQDIARGSTIVWAGRGLVYHAGECAAERDLDAVPDAPRGRGYRSRNGITTFRTSGGTFYRNARGRCEDAPCCGCCTI